MDNVKFNVLACCTEQKVDEYVKALLVRLGETLNNKQRMKDGRLVKFFAGKFSMDSCNKLVNILSELERIYPAEMGTPIMPKDVNESAKILGSHSPLDIANELEKVAGIVINKKGLKGRKRGRGRPPFVTKVVKSRMSLSKRKSVFSKANNNVLPKRNLKGQFEADVIVKEEN